MKLPRGTAVIAALVLAAACTNAGLYSTDGRGAAQPDRAIFEGTICVPPAAGDAFPVKVLFAVPGGEGTTTELTGQLVTTLTDVSGRFAVPYIKFSLVAYHTIATGLAGSFESGATLQPAIQRYASYQEQGPVSVRAPLKLARTILAGDMLTGCRGAVSRSRYMVVLVMTGQDTSCVRSDLNLGLSQDCVALTDASGNPDPAACSRCELNKITTEIKDLAERYGAGEVTVQPVYVVETGRMVDPLIQAQGEIIARAGATVLKTTDTANLANTLNGINYTSLQRQLIMKRLIAFNRNTLSRNGELLADSDEDGLADADEERRGTDPAKPDTDDDGLMDGLEVRMGLNPLAINTVNGCNRYVDTDGDRLNDCEERVLGTEACMGDTDADGVTDTIEMLSRTNPLLAEGLQDQDRDGVINMEEILDHTDPLSADVAYKVERAYGYDVQDTDPTPDGRACYTIRISNISLVPTLSRPNPPFADVPANTNNVYLYMQAGRANEPKAASIGSVLIRPILYDPASRRPVPPEPVDTFDFVLGI